MRLEKLLARHQQEISDYWHCRSKRLFDLQKSQNEIVGNYLVMDEKFRKEVDDLLTKRRETWEQMEKDELDLLLHIQTLEKENLMNEEEKHLRVIEMLSSKSDKDKGNGR